MSARKSALAHLANWTVAALRLPAGATLLEPVDSSATWWAIRHPRTGALFGWHADPYRLAWLYWQALGEDQRLDLVAEAVARIKHDEHHIRWKYAWSNWTSGFGARLRAAERAATAWIARDRQALERAMARLAEALYPDPDGEPPAAPPGGAIDPERLSLELATAALVEGDDQLARFLYGYSLVAGRDRSQLPALLAAAAAAVGRLTEDRLTEDPGEESRRG